MALLGVFACVQAGQTAKAGCTLRGMVAPASVGVVLERACVVALALADAGLVLGADQASAALGSPDARLH